MNIFQIYKGRAHWKTPFLTLEDAYNVYPSDLLFIEAPDEVQEGWLYDAETGEFAEPPEPEPELPTDTSELQYALEILLEVHDDELYTD